MKVDWRMRANIVSGLESVGSKLPERIGKWAISK